MKVNRYERRVVQLKSEKEKLAYVVSLNERRRQLTVTDRKHTEAELRKRGMSYRDIGNLLDVSHMTVKRDLAGVTTVTPATITGRDGRQYSSAQRPTISTYSERDIERARAALKALGKDAPKGNLTLAQIEKKARANEVRLDVEPDHSIGSGPSWRLECADIRTLDPPENSFDLILTDPPYTTSGLPLYGDLARFAARTLKPSGLLIAYTGKLHLPEIANLLGAELDYYWTFAIIQNLKHTRTPLRKIEGGYRPVLVYAKRPLKATRWMSDTIISTSGPEKSLHQWQQALEPMCELLRRASKPGDQICDPFAGAGTSGVAALLLNRRYFGVEINPKTMRVARKRLEELELTGAVP